MKRDMDLVRLILLKIEETENPDELYNFIIEGYTREELIYHLGLLNEAGMLSDYNPVYAGGGVYFYSVSKLTWEGHDFLDSIRDNSQWKKIKDTAKEHGLPMVIDVIKTLATTFTTAALEGVVKGLLPN